MKVLLIQHNYMLNVNSNMLIVKHIIKESISDCNDNNNNNNHINNNSNSKYSILRQQCCFDNVLMIQILATAI